MRTIQRMSIAAVLFQALPGGLLGGEPSPARPPADFVVAVTGDDRNPGTEAQPLATIRRARDAVRELRKAQPERDVLALIRGGTYYVAEPLMFTSEDSGRERGTVSPHRSSDRHSRREVDRWRRPATPGPPRQVVSRRDVGRPRRSGGRYPAADRSPAGRDAETVPTEDSQPAVSSHHLAGFRQRRDAGRRLLSRQPPAEQPRRVIRRACHTVPVTAC